jgi:general secretion pathway protein B
MLLLINLAVLISLLMRPDADPVPAVLTEDIAITGPAEIVADTAPDFQEQITVARQNPPQRQESVSTRPAAKPVQKVQAALISQDPASVPESSLYPTLQEVRAGGASGLPELHLDIHVYSDTPEERFVFINMVKHREGSQLAEGPVVAEITPDGVVLGHRGNFVLLPRE